MKSKLLGAVCIVVVAITLTLGLWPFHSPKNNVTWLKHTHGVAFGKYGTVLSSGALPAADFLTDTEVSVEIWAQPDRWNSSATILALYRPEKGLLFTLNQSLTDLELQAEVQSRPDMMKGHFYVSEALGPALRQRKQVFITVTSGRRGTSVYLDGAPARVAPEFRIPDGAFRGRLIVGDSPRQPDSFRGQIRGLALYDSELSGAQVLRHYQAWVENGCPDATQNERNVALYLFDEHSGNVVRNHSLINAAEAAGDLHIPETYEVIDKIALEPFWKEFNFSRGYWNGNFKNIIGFMPAGFCFFAYFTIARPVKRAVLITIFLGALVSLAIEVFQAHLPTRDSGTTDLITNILGTYLGVLCYRIIYSQAAKRFPWVVKFAAPVA